MNLLEIAIYGILGLVVGINIPMISIRIIEYKKGKGNLNIKDSFLSSVYIKCIIALINCISWVVVGSISSDILISMFVVIQVTLAIIIAYIDLNIRIIPNELVLTIIILGILYQTIFVGLYNIISSLMSMLFIMVVFTAIAGFMGFGKVGAGDVKLAGAIGISLGYPQIITALGIMAVILFVFIIIGLLFKKIQMTTMLPMAPFLSAGYVIALLTGIIK